MHVISKKKLREFWEQYPAAKEPLLSWWQMTRKARWKNLAEARADFPHADPYQCCTIFNIGGNKYRLISKIYDGDQVVLVREVLTHKEYDQGTWKNDCES